MLRFEAASPDDMPFLVDAIRRFRLDAENLDAAQFLILREGDRIVAFGRIKPYRETYELGCLGVVEAERGRGLGEKMVRELIARFPTREVYVTTDLRAWFESLGFRVLEDGGPPEIAAKVARVQGRVRDQVVAMVYEKGEGESSVTGGAGTGAGSGVGRAEATTVPSAAPPPESRKGPDASPAPRSPRESSSPGAG